MSHTYIPSFPEFGKAILVCLFLFAARASGFAASSPDTAAARVLRAETLLGLDYAYNFDFQNAERSYNRAIAIEPLYPGPYLGKTSITFWKLLLDRSDSTYNQLLSQADDVIDHAEKYMDKYGKNADVLTCLGTVYGYRAFAHGRMKSYFKAAWDGKKSYDDFEEALALDRQWYDAYSGLGIYHYFASFMPKALQWIVGILGVRGDNERGMMELGWAMQRGVYHRVEAKFYLAELLPWHSDNFDSSEVILRDLSKAYPKNTLFTFTMAIWALRKNDATGARDLLQKIEPSVTAGLPGLRPFIEYKLGECNYRLLNFQRAEENYRKFLGMYGDDTYLATANYRLGICLELQGKRTLAMPFYRTAAKASRIFGDDAYASRKAEALVSHELSDPDSALIRAQGLLRSGRGDKALGVFSAVTQMPGANSSIIAEATYGMGEALAERHAYREALEDFHAVAGMKLNPVDAWLEPWSHYQGGMCLVRLNEKAMAKKEFEKTLEFGDYDFENWISYRARRELDDLKK